MADLDLAPAALSDGGTWRFPASEPLRLDSGGVIEGLEVAYQTYGQLNADRSNAVLICHALTGDQHVASPHPVTGKPGWWLRLVGPGKPLDPTRHFIICSNVVGGCMGSTG
ncbi:MAG: homoserine O-acetyltransferase, partial [Caulobacter sp. 35-67-4]